MAVSPMNDGILRRKTVVLRRIHDETRCLGIDNGLCHFKSAVIIYFDQSVDKEVEASKITFG